MNRDERDRHLLAALAHAPDHDVAPPAALDDAILRAAAVAASAAEPKAGSATTPGWVARLWQALSRPALGGGAAVAATLVLTVSLWTGEDLPGPQVERARPPAAETAGQPSIDTAAASAPDSPTKHLAQNQKPPLTSSDIPALAKSGSPPAPETDRSPDRGVPAARAPSAAPIALQAAAMATAPAPAAPQAPALATAPTLAAPLPAAAPVPVLAPAPVPVLAPTPTPTPTPTPATGTATAPPVAAESARSMAADRAAAAEQRLGQAAGRARDEPAPPARSTAKAVAEPPAQASAGQALPSLPRLLTRREGGAMGLPQARDGRSAIAANAEQPPTLGQWQRAPSAGPAWQWRRSAQDAWQPLDEPRRAALVELALDYGEAWQRPPPPSVVDAAGQTRLSLGQLEAPRVQLVRAGGYLLWYEGEGAPWALAIQGAGLTSLLARLGL